MRSVSTIVRAAATPARRIVVAQQAVRCLHASAPVLSAKNPGPAEQKNRAEFAAFKVPEGADPATLFKGANGEKVYSPKVKKLVDELMGLTLLDAVDFRDLMMQKMGKQAPDVMFPGFGIYPYNPNMVMTAMPAGGAAGAPAAGAAEAAAPAPAEAPKKEEKTHVDIKLKGFDAKNKIKVIKEIRGVTNLGLKEAKELVEGAPCTILEKVKKEDAAAMIEKLKAETGAEFELV